MTRTLKMESKPNIIIVDDKKVFKKLKKLLNNKSEYNVNTFVSAEKAFTNLKSNNIDLVISEYQNLTKTLGEKINELTMTNSKLDGLQKEIIKAFV